MLDVSKQTKQLLLLLLLTISAVTILQQSDTLPKTTLTSPSQTERPMAFARNASYRSYKTVGRPSMTFRSKESLYYAESGRILIDKPVINVASKEQLKIQLSAQNGIYITDDEALSLFGNVTLVQTGNQSPITLNTERLEFNTATRFISTDQIVNIIKDQHHIDAVGMSASIDDKIMTLHSKVKGQYFFGNSR